MMLLVIGRFKRIFVNVVRDLTNILREKMHNPGGYVAHLAAPHARGVGRTRTSFGADAAPWRARRRERGPGVQSGCAGRSPRSGAAAASGRGPGRFRQSSS